MSRILSLVLLVVGLVLLVTGLNAHDSILSTAKEAVTGTPTDRSIALIVVGLAGVLIGGLGLFTRRNN